MFHLVELLCCALKQAKDKEKKEKKTKDKEKEKEEAAAPPAEEAPPPAAEEEEKPTETKKDEPKKKIGNVFALFNQSQITEFKEVNLCVYACRVFVVQCTAICSSIIMLLS